MSSIILPQLLQNYIFLTKNDMFFVIIILLLLGGDTE